MSRITDATSCESARSPRCASAVTSFPASKSPCHGSVSFPVLSRPSQSDQLLADLLRLLGGDVSRRSCAKLVVHRHGDRSVLEHHAPPNGDLSLVIARPRQA